MKKGVDKLTGMVPTYILTVSTIIALLKSGRVNYIIAGLG
jgi:hypothetical protein